MDFDRDGYREATAWAGPQDGVLAIDLAADGSAGPDGRLTNVMEVAFARWFVGAKTDLMGLRRAFDQNGDGVLDGKDPGSTIYACSG